MEHRQHRIRHPALGSASKLAAEAERRLLMDQYQLYVQMIERAEARRASTSQFYGTLLIGLLAFLPLVVKADSDWRGQPTWLIAVGVAAIALCRVWAVSIANYRELSRAKWAIVCQMEGHLPFACFGEENRLLQTPVERRFGKPAPRYSGLTRIEAWAPTLMAVPYALIAIYGLQQIAAPWLPGLQQAIIK